MAITSRPSIPEVIFERIKTDLTEFAFNFFQDGISLDVSARTYKVRLKTSGVNALDKASATNAAGRVTFTLTDTEKTNLNSSEYQFFLVEILAGGGEKTLMAGSLRWSVPFGKPTGLVSAPDVSVNYITATQELMVALGVVDFGSMSSAISAAQAEAAKEVVLEAQTIVLDAEQNIAQLALNAEVTRGQINEAATQVASDRTFVEQARDDISLGQNPLGEYNALTNTPILTTTPPPDESVGAYFDVSVSGPAAFGGSNFALGETLPVGGRLFKKNSTTWRFQPPSNLALQKAIKAEIALPKAQFIWKDREANFNNLTNEKEVEVINSIRDVIVYSDNPQAAYALNYIRRGDASNPTIVSIYRTLEGTSFPTNFATGVQTGIQSYICINPENGDEVNVTIDWSLITTPNINYYVDVNKAVFARSTYSAATKKGNSFVFENPQSIFTQTERKVINGVLGAAVKSTNPSQPTTYGINYITKGNAGSPGVATRISLTIDKGGTSFSVAFAASIPTGIVEYKCVNPTNFDEVYITLDWNKITSNPGEQVFIAANKATISKSAYSTLSFLQRDIYESPSAAFNSAEIETVLALRNVSIQSVNPSVFYSLYYLQKGNATDATIISIYNNSTASSFTLDAGVGAVSGVRKYSITAPNYDKISVVIDWDRMKTSGTASKTFLDVTRSLINKAHYFYTEWIERKVFEDPSQTFNSAEIETVLALRDISIQSKNLGVYYSLYYIQKGDASNPTIISFYNNSTATSFNQNFGNGVPTGIQKYVINTSPNGDIVNVMIDWNKMSVAGLASKVFQNVTKTLINKSRYKDLFPIGISAPTLVLPTYVPYARGRELPIWKENIRNVGYANEPDTRVDISGNDGARTWLTPDVSFLNGWKYLRQTSESVPANFNVTVSNKLLSGETLNSGTFQIRPTSHVFNSAAQKSILVIGDSHTEIEDRLVTRTLKSLITANSSFIPNFIGTRASTADPTVKNEGRSSWDSDMFTKSGSPFYIGGQVDFPSYMANNGFSSCDIAIIHLGSNDAYRITKEAYEANLKVLITSMWAYNPNMEVIISMPTLGSLSNSDGNYIKTITIPFIEQLKTGFASYNSPNGVPVTICPTYMVTNRAKDWGYVFPTEQRDGQPFPYDTMHLNSAGYSRIADMLFSSTLYALNS